MIDVNGSSELVAICYRRGLSDLPSIVYAGHDCRIGKLIEVSISTQRLLYTHRSLLE